MGVLVCLVLAEGMKVQRLIMHASSSWVLQLFFGLCVVFKNKDKVFSIIVCLIFKKFCVHI